MPRRHDDQGGAFLQMSNKERLGMMMIGRLEPGKPNLRYSSMDFGYGALISRVWWLSVTFKYKKHESDKVDSINTG